ncbi:diaminobutyrate acetyltransferase [Streptomyces jumonjinensis]|uniref:diaminobutyrate acetyltransferase n=1 Tax=Streptomyces jumonjinensis TaxID=1945 RepID=UPI00379705DF
MNAAQEDLVRAETTSEFISVDTPRVEDGAALWRIARDSEVLDLNSSYSYLLWCRDFAATSLVARGPDGEPIAFVTGYARPERPRALVVWQIAVDRAYRGQGLAGVLLDALTAKVTAERGIREMETTITPDNTASERLFTSYAARQSAHVEREVLFDGALFPDEAPAEARDETPAEAVNSAADGPPPGPHQPEVLFRIGPIAV